MFPFNSTVHQIILQCEQAQPGHMFISSTGAYEVKCGKERRIKKKELPLPLKRLLIKLNK